MIKKPQRMTKPALLILAGGMGNRYGGLKQLAPIGPNGETIVDYSVYDAVSAGFGRIIFVIRSDFQSTFQKKITRHLPDSIDADHLCQELDSCLEGFTPPGNREKPWGTAQAVLVARRLINEPFAVINADDYYGPESFRIMSRYLSRTDLDTTGDYAMVGYRLANTLSPHGTVCRGICRVNRDGNLRDIAEYTKISRNSTGITGIDSSGSIRRLTPDETVSMNMWGFRPCVFAQLSEQFRLFLEKNAADPAAEFFIPTVVDRAVKEKQARVKVFTTTDSWFGLTYPGDTETARKHIGRLIENQVYPPKLWSNYE